MAGECVGLGFVEAKRHYASLVSKERPKYSSLGSLPWAGAVSSYPNVDDFNKLLIARPIAYHQLESSTDFMQGELNTPI